MPSDETGQRWYVDGFVLPLLSSEIETYRAIVRKAGRIRREHGALEYVECVGEDLDIGHGLPFPKRLRTEPGETVVFAWIVYESR